MLPIHGWQEEARSAEFDGEFAHMEDFFILRFRDMEVGYLQISTDGEGNRHIKQLHLQHRGHGFGTAVLQLLQRQAIATHTRLTVDCCPENARFRGLCEKLGFRIGKPGHSVLRLEYPDWRIIPYEAQYRDDMIFLVLEAKDALGRLPRLNPDLLDIPGEYLSKGDPFWLALDGNDRVVGCLGWHAIPGTGEIRLQRLYIKARRKHQGIGTWLLHTAEARAKAQGKTAAVAHLGGPEYCESRHFYAKHGYEPTGADFVRKDL